MHACGGRAALCCCFVDGTTHQQGVKWREASRSQSPQLCTHLLLPDTRGGAALIMSIPQRSPATSGRSHCKLCLELIEASTDRIGVEAFLAGRMATAWMHPSCFFGEIKVERADVRVMCCCHVVQLPPIPVSCVAVKVCSINHSICIYSQANRGKCRITEVAFTKGTARAVIPTGPSKFFATLPSASKMLMGLIKVLTSGPNELPLSLVPPVLRDLERDVDELSSGMIRASH